MTKGDNNDIDDVPLYPAGKVSVSREETLGFVRGYVPLVGWAVIAFQQTLSIKGLAAILNAG